ncbi:hypothetical protein A2803_02360 [Candidatus Woesebacteria bacterium RIFCSPHIGHO2_01_FULL_44_21]|uniref:SCP domain-containing protein n=1 Tax=Candidatus Woesebacteria bacterium RIFCSPHIGHO2_01_FULL_44_21 TaxID=1802503 RepID=A0A1F7YW35_9BACT|nr:MAG: hypothetical protein A2803_02360 [Candidatus Woesebacteria bacterium RIFCSPHIGHO2_01_FULL_44_21]OGM70443.1 MAG: hypothetical protein A2897_01625 [Candidatus Woesebacteria bacterium RIFCSPLOWO2_01_FULL_44_24b]
MKIKKSLAYVFQVLAASALASIVLHVVFLVGYSQGYIFGVDITQAILSQSRAQTSAKIPATPGPTPTPQVIVVNPVQPQTSNWSGPELWEAVNARRRELGVNGISNQAELCTIASIRLNELLDLGQLDGHEGFSTLPDRRPDLKWIFEKYNISEFLVSGAESAQEAVSLWENTLGHKKLLTGGEYVWGCTYAQNGFGVAIAAY